MKAIKKELKRVEPQTGAEMYQQGLNFQLKRDR